MDGSVGMNEKQKSLEGKKNIYIDHISNQQLNHWSLDSDILLSSDAVLSPDMHKSQADSPAFERNIVGHQWLNEQIVSSTTSVSSISSLELYFLEQDSLC